MPTGPPVRIRARLQSCRKIAARSAFLGSVAPDVPDPARRRDRTPRLFPLDHANERPRSSERGAADSAQHSTSVPPLLPPPSPNHTTRPEDVSGPRLQSS
jgi:hypothetical protein